MTIYSDILQRRSDVFHPEHLDTFYTLDRFHINGSRILSRSFHVDPFSEEEDVEEEESNSVELDPEPVETGAQMRIKADREGIFDAEELEEDELKDGADVAMTPMADILNARNACDNVRLYLCTRNPC